MDIVFVILHYMAIDETRRCVRYIKQNIDTENYKIIIVDNASPNGTGKVVLKEYEQDQNIVVLLNDKNLGFAKGNNIGFRYAKLNFNPQYIVLLNNDVYLLEDKIYKKTSDAYSKYLFAVMGPMILTGDGRCNVNPQRPMFACADDIEKEIRAIKLRKKRYFYKCIDFYFRLGAVKRLFNKSLESGCNRDFLRYRMNIKLHGSFLIFSKRYIEQFDGLDESTFMFYEEEFLYKHMKDCGEIMLYNPYIIVYHKEDAATDEWICDDKTKAMFTYDNSIESLKLLKELYK